MDGALYVPLTMVAAPAGYGKSTLVSQWVEESRVPSAWLSLDEGDSDLSVFAHYLTGALETILPEAAVDLWAAFGGSSDLTAAMLGSALLNSLAELTSPVVIVLDDYHRIAKSSALHELLRIFVQHPPAKVHLVLISRMLPSLPLADLRGRHKVTEVRERDLRFNAEETDAFFLSNTSIALGADELADVQEQLEGWAVGMRLVALSLRGANEPVRFLRDIEGRDGACREYLVDQVFSALASDVRERLIRCSVVDRFCEDLLETVCDDGRTQSPPEACRGELFAMVSSMEVFAIPLDAQGRWFRQHHFFRNYLSGELEKQATAAEIAAMHSRASLWFEAEEFTQDAISHALSAEDPEAAGDILIRARHAALNRDQVKTVERWLEALPPSLIANRHDLLIARAYALADRDDFAALGPVLHRVDELLDGREPMRPVAGELELYRAYVLLIRDGDAGASLDRVDWALEGIPAAHEAIRSEAHHVRSLALQMLGRGAEAVTDLARVGAAVLEPSALVRTRLLGIQAVVHLLSGELSAAHRAARQMIDSPGVPPYTANWARHLKGLATLARGDLDKALDNFEAAVEQSDALHTRAAIDAHAGLALTQDLLTRHDAARDTVERLIAYAHRTGRRESIIIAESALARHQLMVGDTAAAFAWARALDTGAAGPVSAFWLETPRLTALRALIREGSPASVGRALSELDVVRAELETLHNGLQLAEVMALQVSGLYALGQADSAAAVLRSLVTFAGPRGHVRPFLEADSGVRAALRSVALPSGVEADRERLLLAIDGRPEPSSVYPPAETNPDELTNRELDVLELAAKRLQNKEIAGRLFISHQTVKSHLKSIFRKLNVQNRRQAAKRGAQLGLIAN
ncbi:MAG: hypothetical protein DRJ42_03195 [Deltaproteobacteria bacterium]|nr:MAG: hypothetical protein DRJ42_03195 [Deltaproteobacteria bacterium]